MLTIIGCVEVAKSRSVTNNQNTQLYTVIILKSARKETKKIKKTKNSTRKIKTKPQKNKNLNQKI